ncbi:MAG: Holliday junction resolvase RuvX [Candidatus Bipolaricaulia bacterium]
MRILGIDYGRKRLGLAMSDEEAVLATPLPYLLRGRSLARDIRKLAEMAATHSVGRIVVGLPLHMDGSSGEMAEEASAFATQIEHGTGLPVGLIDERLTTAEAERVLLEADVSREKRRELRDSLAATLILQSHLDRERAERPTAA